MYSARYSANQYRTNSVNTSPLQLVVMCYDGMLRFMQKAQEAIENNNIPERVKYLNKTIAIVDELQNSLDFAQGGDVARNLERVYDYLVRELMQVGIKNDLKSLAHLQKLVADLREAWARIASDENIEKPPADGTGLTITG